MTSKPKGKRKPKFRIFTANVKFKFASEGEHGWHKGVITHKLADMGAKEIQVFLRSRQA